MALDLRRQASWSGPHRPRRPASHSAGDRNARSPHPPDRASPEATNLSFAPTTSSSTAPSGEYSLNRGSGTVHRRPGGAICIIPVGSQHRGRPPCRSPTTTPKIPEIVSKTRLQAWLTHRPRSRPTAGTRSGILITGADRPMRQNVLFCAFAMDRQLTGEAAPDSGDVRQGHGGGRLHNVRCSLFRAGCIDAGSSVRLERSPTVAGGSGDGRPPLPTATAWARPSRLPGCRPKRCSQPGVPSLP
jgi:hypothetical protein